METMETKKIKQPLTRITRNKIFGNNISKIKLNQERDGGIFGIRDGEIFNTPGESTSKKSFTTEVKKGTNNSKYNGLNLECSRKNLSNPHEVNDPKCTARTKIESMIASALDTTKQPMVEITRNKIYGQNISEIKLNQRENGGTFGIRSGEIVYRTDGTKIKLETNPKRVLIGKRNRISEKNENKVNADSVEIEHQTSKEPNVSEKTGGRTEKEQNQTTNDIVIPPSKRRRDSETSRDDGIPTASIKSEPADAVFKSLIDEIEDDPIVDESDVDELFYGFEPEQNNDRQQMGVEIVREDADPDELVKEEPQFYDQYGNNITIFELNLDKNGGTPKIKHAEIVHMPDEDAPAHMQDENATEVEPKRNSKKRIYGKYFRIIERNGNKVTAECNSCKLIVKDSILTCSSTRRHLKYRHAELYKKYQEKVQQSNIKPIDEDEPLDIEPIDENNTEIEFKQKYKRVLFRNYFKMLTKIENEIKAECKKCHSRLKCKMDCTNLLAHLRIKHPEDHAMYQEEVKQSRYESKDMGDQNEIKVEFKEEFKRILFKDYFKIITKNEDGMTAVCRSCKYVLHSRYSSPKTFRDHLWSRHPDLNKKYKNRAGTHRRETITALDKKQVQLLDEINVQFKKYAKQTLYEKHFRIIEKNEDEVRVVCRHCQLVLMGRLYNNNFRTHLKKKHAEIYETYLTDIMRHKKKQTDAIKNRGDNVIKIQFKTYATRTLYEEHFQIIAKIDKNVRVICNHCEMILKGSLNNNNFRRHLTKKHAEIYETYLKDIKCHANKSSNASKEPTVCIGRDQCKPVELQSERKRQSKTTNDDGMSPTPIKTVRIDVRADLTADGIKDEPVVDEVDINELFGGVERRQDSNRQQLRTEIVREYAGPDEFVKEEPQIYDESKR